MNEIAEQDEEFNKRLAEMMPTEQAAARTLHEAWLRLQDFGWRVVSYAPMRVDGDRSCAPASHHCAASSDTVRDREGVVRPCWTSTSNCAWALDASRRETSESVQRAY